MDRYVLSRGKRRVVRAIAMIFFALAVSEVVQAFLPITAPDHIGPVWDAERGVIGEPELLLPEPARFRLANDAALRERFLTRLREPGVGVGHFLLTLAISLPVIIILGGMGMALWGSTRDVPDAVESGLPWLMAVGWACVAVAIGFPVIDGVRTVFLLRGIMPTPDFLWYDPASIGLTYELLLIAAGILAATWTISAGLKARADIAEIV